MSSTVPALQAAPSPGFGEGWVTWSGVLPYLALSWGLHDDGSCWVSAVPV